MILAATIVLWFMASYPKLPADVLAGYEADLAAAQTEAETGQIENERAAAAVENSFAARLGRWTEPALRPLGFDWRIGVGVIASFAAREVFVGAMGTLYGVGEADDDARSLQDRLKGRRLGIGRPKRRTNLHAADSGRAAALLCVRAAVRLHGGDHAARDELMALAGVRLDLYVHSGIRVRMGGAGCCRRVCLRGEISNVARRVAGRRRRFDRAGRGALSGARPHTRRGGKLRRMRKEEPAPHRARFYRPAAGQSSRA